MKERLLKFNDLEIRNENGYYYAQYDAGAHEESMRKDEIMEEEAKLACTGERGANEMLLALQARLIRAGIDPYLSNM